MVAHEIPVAAQHAAEILRPWTVHSGIDDHVSNVPRPQLLRLGREAQKRVDLALDETLVGLTFGSVVQCRSLRGSSPTWAAIRVSSACGFDPKAWIPTLFPLRSVMPRMPSFANNSKQPTWTPASSVIGSPASIALTKF